MTLPSVTLIAGRPGYGKSRLARRLALENGAVVVPCRHLPGRPYAAARAIAAALGGSGQDETAIRAVLTKMLILDDADHADAASQRVLRRLLADLPSGARLVVTCSPGGLPWAWQLESAALTVTRIELQAMSAAEVAELAGVEDAGQVHAFTGGVPWLVAAAVSYRDGLPPAVRELVSARLARLSTDGRHIAETLCQLRGPAGVSLLAKASQLSAAEVASALDEAVRAELAVERPQGTFRCVPPIISEAICLSTPPSRRREINASLSAAMAHREDGEQIHHARATGDFVLLAEVVDQEARRRRLHGDVAGGSALLRELLLEPDLPEQVRAAIAGRLRRLAVSSVECAETMALLRDILADETLPAGLRGELRLELGLLLLNQAGDPDGGRDELARAAGELRRRPLLAARAMSALAVPLWGTCPVAEHLRWLDQSQRIAPARGDEALRTAIRVNQLYARMCLGDPAVWDEAAGLPAEASSEAVRHQLLRGYANFAGAAVGLGHYAKATGYLVRADRLAGGLGPLYAQSVIGCNRLRVALACGDWPGLAEAAQAHLEVSANPYAASTARLVLGALATARGEWDEARRLLADPALRPEAGRLGAEETEAAAARIRLAFLTGQAGVARAELSEALRGIRLKGVWAWAAPVIDAGVEALVRTGELEAARQLLQEFAVDVSTRDYPHATVVLPGGRAMVAAAEGSLSDAVRLFRIAADACAALPRPYDRARMLEAAARAGDPTAGAEAHRIFARLGATFDAARCAQLLRQSGEVPPGTRPGRRGYGTLLSPREQEVARLMQAGRTHREIAQLLFLSPRTVEQHVARVRHKTQAASHGEMNT